MSDDIEKIELTDSLIMWKCGAHTVTSIEVQAVKLWAKLHRDMVLAQPQDGPGGYIYGFLVGVSGETDEEIASQILVAKENALQAGDSPMSMDPIRQ